MAAVLRSPASSACVLLGAAARRTLAATVAASALHTTRRGAALSFFQASRACSSLAVSAPGRAAAPEAQARRMALHAPAGRGGASRGIQRGMSSAANDETELDPYLPHRINYEKAKEYIKANVTKGMSREEVTVIVRKAMELHIPPVPSLEVSCIVSCHEPWCRHASAGKMLTGVLRALGRERSRSCRSGSGPL